MDRISKLKNILPQEVDCVIVTSDYNRHYFTGMRSSAGTLLITKEKTYFIIDFRYIELAKRTVRNAEVILQEKLYEQINAIFKENNIKNVAVETSYMTLNEYTVMQKNLKDVAFSMDSTVDALILDLRSHKDEKEIEAIKKAQAITDATFTHICEFIKEGMTEKEIALEIEYNMRKLGAENTSFDTICVSGVNSSLPHGVPSDKKVEKGDFVTMDFGCKVDGYCSDMTRTVAIGMATDEMKKVYNTVLEAHYKSAEHINPAVTNVSVDKVGRDLIYDAGYTGCFGHGTGHSVGLEIHENPRYSPAATGNCKVGNIMTVEPGIYLEGKFGVRIENMYLVTENGSEKLTASPMELIIL